MREAMLRMELASSIRICSLFTMPVSIRMPEAKLVIMTPPAVT
jgi:hypothetical protein